MAKRVLPVPARNLVSLAEAAELSGLSVRTLRRRIADGALRAFRKGPKLIFVDADDLDALAVVLRTAMDAR